MKKSGVNYSNQCIEKCIRSMRECDGFSRVQCSSFDHKLHMKRRFMHHVLSIGRCAKNPCTSKERGEFIAHNVALYGRGKKRVTFAGRQEILYIFSERSYKKEMYVWRGDNFI